MYTSVHVTDSPAFKYVLFLEANPKDKMEIENTHHVFGVLQKNLNKKATNEIANGAHSVGCICGQSKIKRNFFTTFILLTLPSPCFPHLVICHNLCL